MNSETRSQPSSCRELIPPQREDAHVLLLADESGDAPRIDDEIAERLEISTITVRCVREQFTREGLGAIERKKPPGCPYRKLNDAQEAQLVVLACSTPPEGRANWTMKLLAHKFVELQVVESIDPATVCRTLKKRLKPWLKQQRVIPAQANAAFGANMEDVPRVRH